MKQLVLLIAISCLVVASHGDLYAGNAEDVRHRLATAEKSGQLRTSSGDQSSNRLEGYTMTENDDGGDDDDSAGEKPGRNRSHTIDNIRDKIKDAVKDLKERIGKRDAFEQRRRNNESGLRDKRVVIDAVKKIAEKIKDTLRQLKDFIGKRDVVEDSSNEFSLRHKRVVIDAVKKIAEKIKDTLRQLKDFIGKRDVIEDSSNEFSLRHKRLVIDAVKKIAEKIKDTLRQLTDFIGKRETRDSVGGGRIGDILKSFEHNLSQIDDLNNGSDEITRRGLKSIGKKIKDTIKG